MSLGRGKWGIVLGVAAGIMCSGCMQVRMLPYLDQALTLQDLSKEQESQEKYVKEVNASFDRMLSAAATGELENYKTEQDVLRNFGPPIISKMVALEGRPLKQVLYRHAILAEGQRKIFIYYTDQGTLVSVRSI